MKFEKKKTLSYFKSAPLNFAKCKVSCKIKKFKFETSTASFVYFWLQFQKTIFIFEINTGAFLKQQSFLQNEKSLNMEPKAPYLNTFRPEFDKFITIFEISTFEFLKKQSFMLKKINLGRKLSYLGIFRLEFGKNYCHIWNQHPQVYQKWTFNHYSEFWLRVRLF